MSALRWLLLLLPSVLVIGTPLVSLVLGVIMLPAAGILCFILGFCLEKWLRGKINSIVWALNFGFMILFGNCFITFAVIAFIPTQVR